MSGSALTEREPPGRYLSDGEIRELVNLLTTVAKEFHDHQSLRERIAYVVIGTVKDKLIE